MLLQLTPNSMSLSIQFPCLRMYFSSCDVENDYNKLDLKNAYQQLVMDSDGQQFITINTHRGLYRYKRLPFGIASSPAIFQ